MADRSVTEFFVEAMYLYHEGCRFDYDHYMRVHVPLAERQSAAAGLTYTRREIRLEASGLIDSKPKYLLTITYYSTNPDFAEAFRAFMTTPLVEPLVADVAKYTDCAVVWTKGIVRTLSGRGI